MSSGAKGGKISFSKLVGFSIETASENAHAISQ
jgi:hypothetical protein